MDFSQLLADLGGALLSPSAKQKEAYGRFFHTLSAASIIGAITVAFSETHASWYVVSRVAALSSWGVVLFCAGALFSKGE
jgi:hypothetical protein